MALEETEVQKKQANHGITDAICNALKEAGYEADLSVGRSEYRIDIGVVDPDHPDQYILGIMLDGSSYGAAKTTRDREIAQISVLSGLGWNILRVWCMDWWDNSDKELKRILKKLKDIRSGKEDIPKIPQPPKTEPDQPEKILKRATQPTAEVIEQYTAPMYTATALPIKYVSAEEFIEPRLVRSIQEKVNLVIKTEAPVSVPMLTRRVVQSFGISRAGSRIQGHMDTVLRRMDLKTTQQGDTQFCWAQNQNPDAYVGFRVSGEGDSKRDVRDVPVQEIANAIYTVLYEQVSMGQDDLLRETANKLGYTRLGSNVLSALAYGITCAQEQGGIAMGANGTFVLSNAGTSRAEATKQLFLPKKENALKDSAHSNKSVPKKTLLWGEYYGKLYDWSGSTLASKASALTSIGNHNEVIEVIQCMDSEAGALKLVKKALELGLRFSISHLAEIECYLSNKGALYLIETLDFTSKPCNPDEVCAAIESFDHEDASVALMKKSLAAGTVYSLNHFVRISGYLSEECALLMMNHIPQNQLTNSSHKICAVAQSIDYQSCCELLIQMAIRNNISFFPEDIIGMDGYVDENVLNQMVCTCTVPFTKEQLEQLQYSISDHILLDAARRSHVILDEI